MDYIKRVYRAVFNLPEPKVQKRKPIPRKIREQVWIKYFGNQLEGYCYVCEVRVTKYRAGWHCSHVTPACKGGKDIVENLRVCCPGCNLSMGDMDLYEYKQMIKK